MRKILILSILSLFVCSTGSYAISPTYSNSTGSTADFYPLMQYQMEKQETLDFVNNSENYKEERAKKDAENAYRAGNKNFNPHYTTKTNLINVNHGKKNMEFSTDSNGNIIIKDSSY